MAKSHTAAICYRQCGSSCLSVVVQLIGVVVFVAGSVWLTAAVLELLHLIDVSTVPPGLKYVPFVHKDGRFY